MVLEFDLLIGDLTVWRFPPGTPLPKWTTRGSQFTSVTFTPSEVSVVAPSSSTHDAVPHEHGWRAFKVRGQLDFSLVGVLAAISTLLADAGISIFVVSTYDTDYVLVKSVSATEAAHVLRTAGHTVREAS